MNELDRDLAIFQLYASIKGDVEAIVNKLLKYYEMYPHRPADIVYNTVATCCANLIVKTTILSDHITLAKGIIHALQNYANSKRRGNAND